MLLLLLGACAVEDPLVSVWTNLRDGEALLEWSTVSLHPAEQPWDSQWPQVTNELSTFHKYNSGHQLVGSGQVPQMRYHHTFVDLAVGSTEGGDLIDIIEPIATPFTAFSNHTYRINIEMLILDGQIFAIDSEVIEE